MKYFKDINNQIHAFSSDGSQDYLISKNLIPISESEAIQLGKERTEDIFNSLSYSIKRQSEYPLIGDQLDSLFKAGVFPADMASKIQAVKNKYPKE